MSKSEPKRPCHKLTRFNYETLVTRTACGLKLDPKERLAVVLSDDWQFVTCAACKKVKPS